MCGNYVMLVPTNICFLYLIIWWKIILMSTLLMVLHTIPILNKLAKRIGDNPVLFAIDGADKKTYEHYSQMCMGKDTRNAKAFIDAGGWAVWSMVLFNWNEHQLETAMDMAKDSFLFSYNLLEP